MTRPGGQALLDQALELHPQVALRPEPFGALAYHYGNRKLVFLRSPKMVAVVKSLPNHASIADALAAAGVSVTQQDRYLAALSSLAASDMISARTTNDSSETSETSETEHTDGPR